MQPAKTKAQISVSFFPNPFPALWASEWGEDEFGLWMALIFQGVRQVFRWILPGTFLMGSPKSEPKRYGDETQHPVTLTQGYWLADTACTQALWQAVMGENPAYFKDDANNPVEQVSWNSAQEFIARLNSLLPELEARLPTGAQWEYACRAGTTTPFSFGKNITPEQVNYHGRYPYAGGKKGSFREKTVPVKSLPPNPWGLYEMHGNVWEWCNDWFSDYPSAPVIDPVGPSNGAYRVLRGGSWKNDGRDVRSAYRYWDEPDDRHDDLGFRLSLGQRIHRSG
jgi:formylglycine-generating enzyme